MFSTSVRMPVPNMKAQKLSEMMDMSPKLPLVSEEVAKRQTAAREDVITSRFRRPNTLPRS